MVGPFVGGILDTVLGWRAVFWLYALLALITFAMVWSDLGETNQNAGRPVAEQLRRYPLLLRDTRFWAFALCNAISLSVFYSFILSAPLVGQAMGLTTAWIGVAMGATPMGYLMGNVVTTRLARSRTNAQLIVMGRVVTFSGMLMLVGVSQLGLHPALYFGLMISIGIGNGLTLPGAYAGAMSVRPELAGSAAGMVGALNVGLGAVVTFAAGAFLPQTDVLTATPLLLATFAGCALIAALITRRIERVSGP
jgi:predicted MFS family arabinose efflux permease